MMNIESARASKASVVELNTLIRNIVETAAGWMTYVVDFMNHWSTRATLLVEGLVRYDPVQFAPS